MLNELVTQSYLYNDLSSNFILYYSFVFSLKISCCSMDWAHQKRVFIPKEITTYQVTDHKTAGFWVPQE